MALTNQFSPFRCAFIACVLVTLVYAIVWMNSATPYFTGGPRDVPGLEGWWNITLGVGSYVVGLGLLQTLPPWLILFAMVAGARRVLRRDFLQDPTTRTSYLFAIIAVYLFLVTFDVMLWSASAGGSLSLAVVAFSPGLLVAAWWGLQALNRHFGGAGT